MIGNEVTCYDEIYLLVMFSEVTCYHDILLFVMALKLIVMVGYYYFVTLHIRNMYPQS